MNCPQLKRIHFENTMIELSDEQLYQLMEQSGITIGIGHERRAQFEKYVRYQYPGKARTQFINCHFCGNYL